MIDPLYLLFNPLTSRSLLLISIAILTFMTLILLVIMIAHKIYVELREIKLTRLRKKYATDLEALLERGSGHLSILSNTVSVEALADVSISFLSRLDLSASEIIRAELRYLGVVDKLISRLRKSRSWVRRYRALELLGFLRLVELRPLYLELLADGKDQHLRPKILWALSFVAEEQDFPIIISCLGDVNFMSAKFNEYLFTNFIEAFRNRVGDNGTVVFLEKFIADGNNSIPLKRDILESCGKMKFSLCASFIIEAFHSCRELPEMRITTLRAAGEIGAASLYDIILPSLDDPDWRVRVVAAHYAQLCPEGVVPCLEKLLGDSNYEVRINAARSLSRLGDKGKAALGRAVEGADRFAQDICRYVLAGK